MACFAEESEEESSLTLTVAEAGTLALSSMPGTYGTVSQTYYVTTTNATGYSLIMETTGESTGLKQVGGTQEIPTLTLGTGETSKMIANMSGEYGYSLNQTDFLPVPALGEKLKIKKTSVASSTPDETVLTFGVNVPLSVPAGVYQNEFTITAIANPEYDPETHFEQEDPVTFDGTNYLDTGIALFSSENIGKDFTLSFTIDSHASSHTKQETLFSDMNESGSPYPGVVLRMANSNPNSTMEIVANVNSQTNGITWTIANGMEIIIKRVNRKLYYSNDGGATLTQIADYTNFNYPFDTTATIGAGKNSGGEPFRYFNGTLSNIVLDVTEPTLYTVVYDMNGGTGAIDAQPIPVGVPETLTTFKPTKVGAMFDCWNTEPDGTGTDYASGATVTDLAAAGEVITLYAKWKAPINYKVIFHDNLVGDNTVEQELTYSIAENLDANTFSDGTNLFGLWNTEPDGSGTYYVDTQEVLNLTETENDEIDLYAVWGEEAFSSAGATVFNGSNTYIDSGIKLFDTNNVTKDFVVVFRVTTRTSTGGQATIVSAMDETGSPYPGMVYRVSSSTQNELIGNATKSSEKSNKHDVTTEQVVISRESGVLYLRIGSGTKTKVIDFSTLTKMFDDTVVFGAGSNGSGGYRRWFKGTVENMAVVVLPQE